MTPEKALETIAGYLNWTEDEFHIEARDVRKAIRAILAKVTPKTDA